MNKFIIILLSLFSYTCSIGNEESAMININVNESKITLIDKISQMIVVRMNGKFYNNEHWQKKKIESLIKKYNIGGLITFTGNVHGTFHNIKDFQSLSKTPLFIAADYERGLGTFIDGTLFPSNMALSATNNPNYAYRQGEITGLEAKAIGVNMILAPVLDINNNSDNPIINFRSYGDNAKSVIKFGLPFISGVQSTGLIACAKHYPGHGNTATDSHTSLPIIDISKDELFSNELSPFKAACDAGVKSIMIGHIVIPALDSNKIPSTFSEKITSSILKEKWGYDGLIITDALEMGALTSTTWHGESAVKAIEAGADIILLPLNAEDAIHSILSAVESGRISEERINISYEKIIKEKENLGLFKKDNVNSWEDVEKLVGNYDHVRFSKTIAQESITLVKNDNNNIPFYTKKYKKVSHILISTDNDLRVRMKSFSRDIKYIHGNVNEIYVNDPLNDLMITDILNKVKDSDIIIATMLIRISMDKGLSTIHETHNKLLKKLHSTNIPIIGLSFGSPYLPQYEYLDSYLCAYGYGKVSLDAMTNAFFGRKPIIGKLPVNLNEQHLNGQGIEVKKNDKIFDTLSLSIDLSEPVSIINKAIADSVFPGAQVFVSKNNQIILNESFGNYTYDNNSSKVTNESIYDVASLTKVLSITPVVMKLVQKKMLSLNYSLSDFYPEFKKDRKNNITIKHLLTHSSGLPPYIEYYKMGYESKEKIINDIVNQELIYNPGEKYIYSDLGIILLTDIVEKITDLSLDQLSEKYFFKPLQMNDTYFNPKEKYKQKIVPTEYDDYFRNRLLQGEVHDENAYILNGVSGHAGLFSTSNDIAKMSKMFLDNGVLYGRRLLKSKIINDFSKRQNDNYDRAIGWDTPSRNGKSSAGDYFSNRTYGHLGFTGTSMWIDSEKEIIVIILSNRVHPSRDKKGIYKFRREFHNSLLQNLGE